MQTSAKQFLARQIDQLRGRPRKRIVFPEGKDSRVQTAAAQLARDGLVQPILLDTDCYQQYADLYYSRRQGKITKMEAAATASRALYHAALMVDAGGADGALGGAVNTTAETVRAAIHCIGLKPGVHTVSGLFFMCVANQAQGHQGVLAFADCSLVIDPTAQQVAEIAIATAHSTRTVIGAIPKVALLSFSTKGSAIHPSAQKMIDALDIIRHLAPDLDVDGELQADAALVPSIGASKAPGSPVAGQANTLIFPDIASANIGYKLVERLGGATAFGPFLQGLAKPMNDLSRGCSAEDIYGAAIITALQAE